jgi:hypothetical protein
LKDHLDQEHLCEAYSFFGNIESALQARSYISYLTKASSLEALLKLLVKNGELRIATAVLDAEANH